MRAIKPDESLAGEIESYRAAFLDCGSSMDGTGPLQRMERAADWLQFNKDAEDRLKSHPSGSYPSSFAYVRVSDAELSA
jgi:hypothetical protein